MITRLPAVCRCGDVSCDSLEHVAARLRALGGKAAPLPGARVDRRPLPLGKGKWRQTRQRHTIYPFAPLRFLQIELVGRQRLVRRAGPSLGERLLARVTIILDLSQPFARRIFHQRLQCDRRPGHVVEQRLELLVEEGEANVPCRDGAGPR